MSTTTALKTVGAFVAGEWVTDGDPVEVRAPFDGAGISQVTFGRPEHLQRAIAAAVETFERTRTMGAFERQHVLQTIHRHLNDRREEFARTLALEAGKPIKTARAEVERALFTLQIAAEESTRIYGEYIPLDLQAFTAGRWGLVKRFPLGPVAAITPFNFPLNLVLHKVAPALASGCSIVVKPASQTPLSALLLAECVEQSGWPVGAFSVIPMNNKEAAPLVEDDRLKLLSFTGSSTVGWDLKRRAGKKRVALELGGNAGVIIHDDADLVFATQRCVAGGFSYAGQSCISVQRIQVHQNAYEKFLTVFVPGVQALKFGDPLDESTDVGPMIRESDAIRAEEWVGEAVRSGARVVCGGKRHGTIFEPTVLTNTDAAMKVNCMEVFAPIVTVEPYTDFDEAIHRVNDSTYGLQAGVFTNDSRLIFNAFEQVEVGGVVAGDVPTFRIDHMPYGGVKDSGTGREGIRYAIEEMTERKLLVMAVRG
jgi:acyl-CoA reductase-like NAD-dependent aldehyde dehydrogenase